MSEPQSAESFEALQPGTELGVSRWLTVDQAMIDRFGAATLDPDPMHIDPEWAERHGPFGGSVAFGFLTMSLLTHLLHDALGSEPAADPCRREFNLNYGFDRLRLVTPVRAGARVRGVFRLAERFRDERQRLVSKLDCVIEIEGGERPALVARWLTIQVPADS